MKVFVILIASFVLFVNFIANCTSAPAKKFTTNGYLAQFGYLSLHDESPSKETMNKAITDFQKYAQIPVTGKVDDATLAKLTGPRCGARDKRPNTNRKKRSPSQGSWRKHNLTYSIHGYPSKKVSKEVVKATLKKSFIKWQDVTTLTFQELSDNDENADIIINSFSGQHIDSYPFDGAGGIVAHAFYPLDNIGLDGDLHLDDDQTWTIDGEPGTTDLTWTSLHEIGHSLGLDHSDENRAIMWPWFEGYKPVEELHPHDIETIQTIYGDPKKEDVDIDICQIESVDAVTFDKKTKNSYFFKQNQVWEISGRRKIMKQNTISNMWPELEDNLDAAYATNDGDIIFIKENSLWRYRNFTKIEGPHPLVAHITNIREAGLGKIDGAMVWVKDQKTYFFSGDKYWRYNEENRTIDQEYPKESSYFWKNIKIPVDDAISWRKGKTFFFNHKNFYAFNNKKGFMKIKKNGLRQGINHFIKSCRK